MNRIQTLMQKLNISEQEAIELVAYDKSIDQNVKQLPFDLTDEQQKIAKKMSNSETHKKVTRNITKKIDAEKADVFMALVENLQSTYCDVTIINEGREVEFFSTSGKKYKIVLSCPRK